MADKDNKSKLTYHVWDKDNNEYDIPDEVVQQRGMDNFAKDFEGGYITMFDDKKQKVDVPIEDVGEYRKQGYIWYDTSGNATPINEVGKKPSPSSSSQGTEQSQYPQEVLDAFNSHDNKPGNFKDLAQLNDEYQRGELKKPSLISQVLGMMPKVDAGNIGREQKVGGMIANMLLGDNMQQPQQTQQPQQPQDNNQQVQQPAQQEASPESKEETPVTVPTGVVNNEGLMDAKLANYLENWKQRPDKQGTYFENMVADLLADGTANSNEEAVNMVQSALGRYANRSAMDVTNQVVASLPDDTVQDAEKSIEAQWYSHGVQDKLKQEADSMGISYDDYVGQFLKPAMVQSLVNKYGPNYRDIAEGIATRLYSHDEHVQDRLMNQDINEALSDVISKYTSTSVAKAIQDAEAASNAQMAKYNEQSKYVDAASPFAIGAIAEANKTRDPQKILGNLQKKFGKLYRNPKFLNDMSNAAFKVMQRYGLNGTLNGDPKQFKPMINAAIKNELDQLEVKGMIPRGSADYILKTGIENTIIGKVSRKLIQTDYQNWLEDMANQQYQPGFWENVASGALTFAGDAWSYWLPGAAGGKLTKSMIAKAEGRLAGDLMAKGMERKVAERAAKVLIGKSKDVALKNGAVHGAVTFGGQSAISKPIDEVYRTGQFDENGKIYNPSVGKVIANTLGEVAKQSAVGAIMQGGTIANMVGKGRGLATNILADVGGKVVDSGIMTGQQLLERMAHDPNFKPTGKDAAESFLESMANLTAIGLPGMLGKYARFKDAREFNKKFDFTDQDIAELKRFGYEDLRDAFEKVGIGEYAVEGENAQRLDGQLTQKYMNLMNDKSVPEVLKAKVMAVVEGKRPSSFSPIIDSEVYRGDDGKYYLETYNKDGGVIDRKEYSSHDAARNDEKKMEYEKTLGLASVLEGEFHKEFTQEHLDGLYNKAAQKYNMGEKLTDEDKAAVYLHQNAGAIKDIMDKQQKGIILTEEEQKQINAYRHYYDSALENSSVMREFVNTFEDSHDVAHGTLRKALESKDKKYAPLVESYLKELYNSIELKREMKQTMDDLYNTAHGNEQKRIEGETPVSPVEGSAGGQEPPVSEGPAPYQDRTNSVPSPSNAEFAANPANVANSSAEVSSSENKVAITDAYVMGQNAYKNGDKEGLKSIKYNAETAELRLKRAFDDDEAQMNVVAKAYEDGKDMEQFVAQRANYMTPAQQDAVRKYAEAMEANKGAMDALEHADDGYVESLKQQLSPYTMENGNIFSLTLTDGQRGYWKSKNDYGAGFGVFPDANGKPVVKQVYLSQVKEEGKEIPLQEYVNELATQKHEATKKNFEAMFDATSLKPNDTVSLSINDKDQPTEAKIVSVNPDGTISFNIAGSKNVTTVPVDTFNKFQKFALRNRINVELDAEDAQRAENEAIKGEAEKQERYKKGIFGYAAGQPDYSDTQTDPKVAAEYLQETAGEDRKALFANIVAEKQALQKRINQLREHIANNEEWLSINADLDPKNAETRTLANKQMEGQIADLQARFDNWNKIRSVVMTPEEAQAIKADRTQKIADAGVNEGDVAPTEGREVAVLSDEELKKQYPTMDEASNYIASERKRIYHIQNDEVQPQIDGINEALEQYMNDDIDYSADQLKELNTTKAQLEARQANLSASAKDLKAQDKLLNTLYSAENKEERAKAMEELTPSEQRKVLVADAFKKNDLGAIKEIYKDASIDVMDLTPQTLEEAVSQALRPHSLNAESLQAELGKDNFKYGIGKGYDSNKFNYLLAKKGTGLSVNEFAVRVYNDLPVNLQDMGYSDQDVRNTLLDMFKSYDSVKEMRNVALMNRIAAAEDELSSEEEFYEAQKEREIIERQAENPDYYAYLEDNSVPLPTENELNQIAGMEYDRMMEIEDREREYKQYVKSILPELADYDDRSNEEGYGGGSSLGSDSSRRGVDEGNRNSQEGGSREASAEAETGALHNSTGEGRQEISSLASGEGSADRTSHLSQEASFGERLKSAIAETETEPTEAQKKAGNYKKGHLSFGGYDYTVETPKGVTRSGKDEQGKPWSVTMHDTYGYILGKIGVDGDHIDMFINDGADLDTFDGNVYVVDQVNPKTSEFDEHKVMYGYPSEEAATEAYLANYSNGWKGLGKVTAVPKATFDKWLESSDRKTKPFADYAMIKKGAHQDFISDMEYTYENDVHPSEEDKPKMQKFAERLLNFHQDREDKPEYGYTMLSSNIKGDKLYPNEKKWFGTKKYRQGVSWVDKENACAYELNPRFNAQGYLTAVGVHKLVPLASFNRDIKEVKPSEMTEAQKVAFDAVSTMLKKAGIPVKVISNEEMEKVAEEQDNLAISMLMNDPHLRFNIKTPEQKKAAKAAYDWATEHRPDKYAQYAIVNMDNPNQMPEYFQKKALAEQWRKYYTNAWRIGNYKAFDLNKPFEEQVKNVVGRVPSEFDPYKIDRNREKISDLKKQIKETHAKLDAAGNERIAYQNQLMKQYMDEHGLSSENEIPDDVWMKTRQTAMLEYSSNRRELEAKLQDLENQLKTVAEPGVSFLKGKGTVYGYTDGNEIVLNQEHLNPNTPIHEYQHIWRTAAKAKNPELIEHGDNLIKQTEWFKNLQGDPNYKHLSEEKLCDEAFARLTGDEGEAILEQMAKDAIKENPLDTAKELSVINKLKEWLKKFWYWTLETFTKWKSEDIKKMTLEDIRNLVLRDLAQGVDPRTVLKGQMTKDEAVSLRQQMADNAEPERILEHTEDNWLQDFGKDGRVNTPIGSIKLGENQYKKAGREDRIKRFGLLKPTLERPDVILEKPAPKEGAERQTKYLFVKSFKKVDGTKILNFESITVKQGEDEVSISAHQIEPSKLLKELTESKMLWNRFRGDSNSLGENQGSALTPSANNPSGKDSVLNPHSDAKIRNSFEITKENGGNLSVEDKIKAVSQQFGVDEADVAMYANAIKKGSTAEAARARANIKRHLLQANEDKISSFKELLKYTKPVNEALKENFGDVDAMIEERRKQVEAERNAMEAARKRAEEEEAKRKKHLEELSLIPDDQLDKQYMDALAKGDDATAREMLDEAARRKGYDDTESAYQGVGAWAAPGNPGYESDKARRDDWESSGSDVNLEDMALGYTPQPDDYFSHPERYSQNTPHGLESVKAINTAIDAIKNGEKDVKVKVYRAVPTSVKEGKLRNGDWVTPSKKYADIHGNNRLEGKYRIIEDEVPANQLWWDGNDANEFGFDDGKAYKYKNAKNNRKLNDLVTYDDEGDVIPPSNRFNSRKKDIRFMFAGEKGAAEADKAEEKTYRMDNLKVAEKMERGKKDAKAIKLATGWERGADGKWRYEMPDAKIKDMKDIGGGNIVKRFDDDMLWNDGKLTNVIDAPGLFEAYPQLKDVRIDTDAIMNDMPSNGNYNAKTNTITIHADELKYMNRILNHEIQHAIQYIEGFGKGGSPEQMEKEFKEAQDEWKARAYAHELEEKAKEMGGEYNQSEVEKALVEEYKDLDMSDELPDKETRIKGFNYFARGYADRSMDDTIKRFRLNESTRFDFDSYKEYLKLAGEVESRNVEKRLGMTDEERRNSLAEETEDVPRDSQVVLNTHAKEAFNLPSEEDNKPKKKTERGRIDEATGAFKLAPNGEQSNLSKKQYIEARTKNFKDWFGGDWEKKPKDFKNKLDANGEPLEKYVEGYLNRPKKPTMPKKRKGEDEATFFGRKMLYSQALEDWPKTEADWKKRIDEFDENTLAALTPPDEEAIREKYQKQYENDMASWRKNHPYIKEGEERPLEIPDMRDYQSIQDYGEALRKHEIWKTAPHKDEYDRMAEDEIISKVALMDAVQHPFSEYARLKAMKAEFQHMRHVMQNQKVYDQNTTDAVVQFAKRFMSLGYGDDLGRGSINTLLTIVKNSTGKKSYEISQQLYQVMDVLMNNQLRNFDRAVMKTMSIKELKENAKGIQVQGKLELRGQTTIKAFRDAVSSRISSDKLDEKISNLIDKMAADKKNASSYQDELLGLNLAKQYVDYIDSSRNDAIEIEDLKKLEIENYKDRKGIYKGELTKALLQEHLERLNQYDEALFNNKVERMDRYSQLLANLGGMIDESVKGAREFQERDARRAIKVKMMASADLGDKSMNQHHKENWKTRLSNSDVARLFCSPLGSFDALMREFGSKQINGEGQLWNHFVRGAMKASNDVFKSVREANNEIDLKVSELFGKVTEDKNGNKKGNMILNDLYALERSNKVKSLDVTIRDIEGEQTYKLQQGNLMYIYMVNKMPDGAMKLREMGILDADVERIKENIDPRFLKLADWIQGEFLPKMRTKYNKRHEELFGAPMPMVENYFPLRVLKNARYMEEDVNNTSDGSNALPSTATGAIIKRKTNKLPLDILNADALSVTIDNIKEMENWYNYAPIRKDANTLLSDTTFRNRVQNMTTIYGSGERLWNNVKDATAVAMGTYRPKGGTDLAVSIKNIGKGITGAKISGRLYTAFKQILSFPLFLADADLGRFAWYSVNPYGSFKWAIENMPNFDKRWSGRKLGDTVLMDDPTDWKLWHTNLMEKAAYYGMTPNALVDAVTCAVGARAVYDTKYKQYIKAGLTEERAKEKALSDAEINFNTSQQSSEGAFVSPMQLDRTLESAIFTPFRNSSMLYERKGINALRNLKHRFEKGHKEASIKYMAAQLMEEGVGYEQATKAAEKMYKKGLMHNIADAIVALWLGPIIWNLGGSLGYLIPYLGDDENKKKKMVIDAVILGLLEGPVDGLAGGQFINTAIANTITSDGISLKGLKNVDFSGMPMLSDFNSMIEKFGYDKVAGAQDLMFMVMQSATGFNPKTLTDAINACIDYGNGDMTNAKEIALFVFRLMNGPAATVDNLYIDELGMKGKDAKKLSYEELAKRYAEYKFGKNTFGLGKLYSDEEKQKKLKAIEKSFDKKVSERLAGMDREDLKNEFSESRSQKEKKLIGKIIADELGTKDSEAVKKAKADASYLRQRNFSDLMDDLYLQKEWEATNEANAGLEELKGNGASEKEIEAYKTKHKAALDKRKAIQKARKKMQKKKADISSDNDEATMAAIRKLRDSILKTVRQKKK